MALSKIQAESMNLADTYAFSGTVSGVGGLIKLASTTVSSSVALVAFDSSIITSTYDTYYFTIQGVVPSADNTDFRARTSIDNGSNFVTHETSFNYYQMNGTDTGRYHGRADISITDDENDGANDGINGQVILFNVNNTATDKHAVSDGLTTNGNGGSRYAYTGRTLINTSSALNYIKFYGDQNIVAGTITVYGLVK